MIVYCTLTIQDNIWQHLPKNLSHLKKKQLSAAGYFTLEGIVLITLLFFYLVVNHGDVKADTLNLRSGEVKALGSGRSNHSSLDNG